MAEIRYYFEAVRDPARDTEKSLAYRPLDRTPFVSNKQNLYFPREMLNKDGELTESITVTVQTVDEPKAPGPSKRA